MMSNWLHCTFSSVSVVSRKVGNQFNGGLFASVQLFCGRRDSLQFYCCIATD